MFCQRIYLYYNSHIYYAASDEITNDVAKSKSLGEALSVQSPCLLDLILVFVIIFYFSIGLLNYSLFAETSFLFKNSSLNFVSYDGLVW